MNIRGFDVITSLFTDPNDRRRAMAQTTRASQAAAHPRELYALLEAYYGQNGLYDRLAADLHQAGVWQEGLKGLRNPAFRVVEFYTAKLWPGSLPEALPIETENERIIPAIEQVWTWSNWSAQKQVAARWLAMYGDLFLKVAQREDRSRVYFQLLNPAHVSDFDTDERGYLTYVRLDIPTWRRVGDGQESVTVTEVWSKDLGTYRLWTHRQGLETDLHRLGPPDDERTLVSMGIDFVPIVHVMFRDVGAARGVGAFTPCLDKIDEANRQVTRLHQMLFRSNKDTWVLSANGVDPSGRPLPPPRLGDVGEPVRVEDQTLIALPGNTTLTSMVPSLNYEAALRILQDHMAELADDLPELTYWRMRDLGDLSGIAVQRMLSGTIARALEARGNAESGLIRANQMALTMGAESPRFSGLGTYEDGAFDHRFAARPIIPGEPLEQAQTDQAKAQAGVLKKDLGWSEREILKRDWGFTDEEVEAMLAETADRTETLGQSVLRQFDRGVA